MSTYLYIHITFLKKEEKKKKKKKQLINVLNMQFLGFGTHRGKIMRMRLLKKKKKSYKRTFNPPPVCLRPQLIQVDHSIKFQTQDFFFFFTPFLLFLFSFFLSFSLHQICNFSQCYISVKFNIFVMIGNIFIQN